MCLRHSDCCIIYHFYLETLNENVIFKNFNGQIPEINLNLLCYKRKSYYKE